MKINSVSGINFNYTQNQTTKVSKPISFGEEHWDGDPSEYDKLNRKIKNDRINDLYSEAKDFNYGAKKTIKYLKNIAQTIYMEGKSSDFREKEGQIDIEGDTYSLRCIKKEGKKAAILNCGDDKIVCVYKNNPKGSPKEYLIESGKKEYDKEYIKLEVSPEKTVFTYKDKESSDIQKITYDKKGFTYEKKDGINSLSYEQIVKRNFPHSFKPQYIENVGWRDEDARYTYTFNPLTKNWDGVLECIKRETQQ